MLSLLIAIVIGHEPLRVPLTPLVDGRPVIVHLVGREHVVSITASPEGPLYSAKTKDGTMVASGLTLQQLREAHPDLYRRLQPALVADASVNLDH